MTLDNKSKSVVCISWKKNEALHMIVDNVEFAKKYCNDYPEFTWDIWAVHKKLNIIGRK